MRVTLHAGNELQMMLRRMVPSHPQADARKLAQSTQQQSQQQQQQQQRDQMRIASENDVGLEHAVSAVQADVTRAEETIGGAMDLDEGELPPDDEEYSPDSGAPAPRAPAQQPQEEPADADPPVRPNSDVSTITDAPVPPMSAQPSNAAAASPAAGQPPDASPPLADAGHAATDNGAAEAAAGSDDTAKSRGGCGHGESAQSQPPAAAERGDLPELDEEVAATAMQVRLAGALLVAPVKEASAAEIMRSIYGPVIIFIERTVSHAASVAELAADSDRLALLMIRSLRKRREFATRTACSCSAWCVSFPGRRTLC